MNRFSTLVWRGLIGLCASTAWLTPACGVDVQVGETSTATGSGGASAAVSSSAVDGATTAGATTASATTAGATTASATTAGATSSSSTGGGSVCGGFSAHVCADDEYCDYPGNSCGIADEQGTCMPRPKACPFNIEGACSCGGVFDNACAANAAGYDIAYTCKSPGGKFNCGSRFCSTASEYCQRAMSDVFGIPDSYTCLPRPSGCALCSCLSNVPCGSMCAATSDGGLVVTCPGG
jgi:hypothetical protein